MTRAHGRQAGACRGSQSHGAPPDEVRNDVRNARIRKPIWTAAATAAIAGVFALPVAAMADEGQDPRQGQGHQLPAAVVASAAPSGEQLHPLGVTAQQKTFTPSAEQMANAKAIVETGKAMGLPPRAWVIAVATSLQESNLENVGHLGDR